VYEIENGAPLTDLLDRAGLIDDLTAVLIGGYFGSWLDAQLINRIRLSPRALTEEGASLGAGVIIALGASALPRGRDLPDRRLLRGRVGGAVRSLCQRPRRDR
jgi:hypothetical protein